MSQLTPPISLPLASRRAAVRGQIRQLQGRWQTAEPKTRTAVQVAVLLLAVLAAYNYSLTTLLQLADLNTPLAYVSLVPVIALILAAVNSKPLQPEPDIHDRQTDYIIGVPLMLAALLVNDLLPNKLSALFWVWRIDLLTLPFFVAGAVSVIFGVRVLWRQKLAVGFLFLAWPYPYTSVLLGVLNAFTSATLFAVVHIVDIVHFATPQTGLGNTLFSVVHNGKSFNISVVSACSGVSSVVGFLLVGSAFAAIVRGPVLRKILWLIGGMLLLWIINLARIILIFWAGEHFGEHFAIDILHPYIGLVTFTAGVGLMIVFIKPLGLRFGFDDIRGQAANPTEAVASRPLRAMAVPKVYLAISLVVIVGILAGMSDLNLRSYNLVADVSGNSKLFSYIDGPVTPTGWISRYQTTFQWAQPLFGENSTWNRYTFYPRPGGDLHAQTDLVADVIDTPDLEAFSAFGIEQCYQFHGYSLTDVSQVALTGGITGQSMSFSSQQYGSWSIVYWILPVKQGATTDYERVVLYVQNQKGLIAPATEGELTGIKNISGSLSPLDPADRVLVENRDFLVAYARELITAQAKHSSEILAQRTSV